MSPKTGDRRDSSEATPKIRPEVKLNGRNSWLVSRLAEARGEDHADIVRMILDLWVDSKIGRDFLVEFYDLDPKGFGERNKVKPFEPKPPENEA